MTALNQLFVYGTLMPNQPNHHWLANIGGRFETASMTGVLIPQGWGAAEGYPAIIPCEQGRMVEGYLFCSDNLPEHWQALDDFEGEGYVRTQVMVTMADGSQQIAWVYALAVDEQEKVHLIATYQQA
ncbi:gamma-glutamylcyclotransferase [uncultured Moraxella sp.]|uniref:gamma-glutamylcyclotransferase family protein n=1 Tax=uncultured Moraxella sp. TaxID=263769 RepID=UPI0025FA6966|nr:gamma-glutamylcyclotransferase family protein [uncultured Moraxella sp.]